MRIFAISLGQTGAVTQYPVRRAIFALLVLSLIMAQFALAWATLAPGGWRLWEVLVLICFAGTAPWTALNAANALIGLPILLFARHPAAAVLPALRAARPGLPEAKTAIAVCIRHEDMAAVFAPLDRLMTSLALAGAADRFTLWFLSDTTAPGLAAAEEAAIAAFPHPARYRRRVANTGFKAGNVMDFLDHHAGDAAFMLCLDADSEMSAAAILRLVACLEAAPRIAILQQLIVGRPTQAAFPRLFQFGMRAGMRSWATGQAWWQGPAGPYWGHNALIRIAPFRSHARLETLPDGSHILSHDQVESARLQAAGWEVWCLPDEEGSMEGNPPALPEFLARDLRWAAGNMQYVALLQLPGLTRMGRWQLAQAILLFLDALFWLGVLVFGTLNALTGGGTATPSGTLAAWMLAVWTMLYAPKLSGYLEVLVRSGAAGRYGGRARFLAGGLAELLFTALLEPLRIFSKGCFLLALAAGHRGGGWAPQNRALRGIGWTASARLFWAPTLFGAAIFSALAAAGVAGWALPLAGGLLCGIPFCVITASPRVAAWLGATGLAATPEERDSA